MAVKELPCLRMEELLKNSCIPFFFPLFICCSGFLLYTIYIDLRNFCFISGAKNVPIYILHAMNTNFKRFQ